jgi:sensor histidine kinase regulating citrate/malate metabolism
MANHSYQVEVQSDFLEKITRAKPVQALAEFIWNSLDADASTINVTVEENGLGVMSKIIVRDNGTGMKYGKAPEQFSSGVSAVRGSGRARLQKKVDSCTGRTAGGGSRLSLSGGLRNGMSSTKTEISFTPSW